MASARTGGGLILVKVNCGISRVHFMYLALRCTLSSFLELEQPKYERESYDDRESCGKRESYGTPESDDKRES